MHIACLKGKELIDDTKVKAEDGNIKIEILGTEDRKIWLHEIPSLTRSYHNTYYTQIGACMYLALEDYSNDITFIYILEQEIKNNKLKIKNIYDSVIVGKANILERFFKYDAQFEHENLHERLINVVNEINVIVEKEYLIASIREYLEENDTEIVTEIEQDEEIKQDKITLASRISQRQGKGTKRTIICNGIEYKSINEFVKANKLPHSTTWYALQRGETPEEILKKHNSGKRVTSKGNSTKAKEYEYEGEKMTLTQLSEFCGIGKTTLYHRIASGWSVEKAVETPVEGFERKPGRKEKKYIHDGKAYTLKELSDLTGLHIRTVGDKLLDGWTVEKLLDEYVEKIGEDVNENR